MPHQHTGDNIVTRAINWLRRGYPQGVPSHDNIAVLYVLKRHLSNEDIEAVIKEMIDASPLHPSQRPSGPKPRGH